MNKLTIIVTIIFISCLTFDYFSRRENEKYQKKTQSDVHDLNLRLDEVSKLFHNQHETDSIIIAETKELQTLDSIEISYKNLPSITDILKRINEMNKKIDACPFTVRDTAPIYFHIPLKSKYGETLL